MSSSTQQHSVPMQTDSSDSKSGKDEKTQRKKRTVLQEDLINPTVLEQLEKQDLTGRDPVIQQRKHFVKQVNEFFSTRGGKDFLNFVPSRPLTKATTSEPKSASTSSASTSSKTNDRERERKRSR